MPEKILLSWSSGKDSAWALHVLRRDPAVEIAGLFTTVNQKHARVSMHATRVALLRRQAENLHAHASVGMAPGLPLEILELPDPCGNEEYAAVMRRFIEGCVGRGIKGIAFGDLFLEDIRQYREQQLQGTGVEALFPLWQIPTAELAEAMLSAGVGAYLSSVDLKKLPEEFVGRKWSRELLRAFPPGIDPCGENGEFHTIVAAGPMFSAPIPIRIGQAVQRDGFAYADVVEEGLGIRD
ncbi:MAG: adenine nucleotide alpha hydrolase [Pirellulales bacterium]|nr:adenine nucleotide alpha hydrolase [Pirellulales bacterium]